ncbi:response regulator [Clostridium ganghwense]|uniref:Transcriptional regulatory protein n=1 Tax=Clostridium ganghwense TaxID=312089 RepID=A0ABT4CPL5_9CLOT|nr:response regulator [Clostridium ganghwense]MCY6370999.1 response regulator [Clostridium ganghwense]
MIKVLIVEDDPMVAQINKSYTESIKGLSVIGVCKDGKEALETIKNTEIDLIILDVYMPKMDGITFLKEMRKHNIMTDVIMVTAAHEVDKLDEVLKLGAVDYLIKPFEYERFKEALNRFVMRYKFFKEQKVIKQEDIDKITSRNKVNLNTELQKGLHKRTLQRIRDFMKDHSDRYFTSEEVAEAVVLSRVTIRRYMNYMAEVGDIKSDIEYGTVGRPSTKYKWKD